MYRAVRLIAMYCRTFYRVFKYSTDSDGSKATGNSYVMNLRREFQGISEIPLGIYLPGHLRAGWSMVIPTMIMIVDDHAAYQTLAVSIKKPISVVRTFCRRSSKEFTDVCLDTLPVDSICSLTLSEKKRSLGSFFYRLLISFSECPLVLVSAKIRKMSKQAMWIEYCLLFWTPPHTWHNPSILSYMQTQWWLWAQTWASMPTSA